VCAGVLCRSEDALDLAAIEPSRAPGEPRESLLSMRSDGSKSVKRARDFVRPKSPRTLPAEGFISGPAGRTSGSCAGWGFQSSPSCGST
jgi:hypothetical protein